MPAQAKTLLIDGSNAVHAVFGVWPETRDQHDAAAEEFVAAIADWAGRQNAWETEVIFDGGARPLGPRQAAGMRVLFSDGESADSVILERARALRYFGTRATVVTWDKALAQAAKEEGARVMGPDRLWDAVCSGAPI